MNLVHLMYQLIFTLANQLIMFANLFLVAQCVRLYNEMNATAARRVMFSSYIYLPVILLALLASKKPPTPKGEQGKIATEQGLIGKVKNVKLCSI